jgi:hypothetical protein
MRRTPRLNGRRRGTLPAQANDGDRAIRRAAQHDEGFSGQEVPNPLERQLPDRQALGCTRYAVS